MTQPTQEQPGGPATSNSHIYLLRIWRTDVGQPWRITLRRAGLPTAQHFPSVMTLVVALWQQLKREDGLPGTRHPTHYPD